MHPLPEPNKASYGLLWSFCKTKKTTDIFTIVVCYAYLTLEHDLSTLLSTIIFLAEFTPLQTTRLDCSVMCELISSYR